MMMMVVVEMMNRENIPLVLVFLMLSMLHVNSVLYDLFSDKCYQETLMTLQYGQTARGIKNKVKVNLVSTTNVLSTNPIVPQLTNELLF